MSFPTWSLHNDYIPTPELQVLMFLKSPVAPIVPYLMLCKQEQPRELNIIQTRKSCLINISHQAHKEKLHFSLHNQGPKIKQEGKAPSALKHQVIVCVSALWRTSQLLGTRHKEAAMCVHVCAYVHLRQRAQSQQKHLCPPAVAAA